MRRSRTLQLIQPDWPCPPNVKAVISTRRGGVSSGAYASGNLSDHVGDDPALVLANRQQLAKQTGVPNWPWLQQVHGTDLVQFDESLREGSPADGVYTSAPGRACAVLTADCLPVLLCNDSGTQVAAVHAGWKGLAAGILNKSVEAFADKSSSLMAYLGPAIGPEHFEVGADVYTAFAGLFGRMEAGDDWQSAFVPASRPGHYLADLYGLARSVFSRLGVERVYGGNYCTFADQDSFYSYRRDGVTGRMVSAIWLES